MKILLLILLSLSLYSFDDGVYIEGDLGIDFSDELQADNTYVYDDGVALSLALGYRYNRFRFDIENIYLKNSLESLQNTQKYQADGGLIQNSQLLNLYYSGYNATKLFSSIGLGVGVSTLELNDVNVFNTPAQDIKETNLFTYQATFSVGYTHSHHFCSGIKYRYIYIQEYSFAQQNLSYTLRYIF